MQVQDNNTWKSFYAEAEAFSKAAVGAFEKKKFSHDTLYNIVCMSVEKYLVSYLMFKGEMPLNHTLSGLANEIKTKYPLTAGLEKDIYFIDTFQDICIIESVKRKAPGQTEMQKMISTLTEIKEWVGDTVGENLN